MLVAYVGIKSYRQMDDRKGVPLRDDLRRGVPRRGAAAGAGARATSRGHGALPFPAERGLFIAFEGGEGTGKTTQARLLAIWLREQGYDVVTTHEPGATKIGMRLRALLLDTRHTGMSPHAEALMYAADRAEHVASVIEPALDRGAVVITDRYVDSSLAYQGAGRELPLEEIARLNRWATGGQAARPDHPARHAARGRPGPPDPFGRPAGGRAAEFHRRVRAGFLALARAEPAPVPGARRRGADRPSVSREIQDRIRDLLPDPVPARGRGRHRLLPGHHQRPGRWTG